MNFHHLKARAEAMQSKARRIMAADAVDEDKLDQLIADAWSDGFQAGVQNKD